MRNLLFNLSIIYHGISAWVLFFIAIYQWKDLDKVWPLVGTVCVVFPMCIVQVLVLLHVKKAIPLASKAEQEARRSMVHQLYPASEGVPLAARAAGNAGVAATPARLKQT